MTTDEIEQIPAQKCKACDALFPDLDSAYGHVSRLRAKTLPFEYDEGSILWFDTDKTKLAQSPDHLRRVFRVELVRNYRKPSTHENMCDVRLIEPYEEIKPGTIITEYAEVALSHEAPKNLPVRA